MGIFCTIRGFSASQNWTLTTAPFASWAALACSKDGAVVIAGSDYGSICVSTNSGATWITATNPPNGYWTCSAISADGSQMIIGEDGGMLHISRDRGITWNVANVPRNYWTSLACSTNGEIVVATAYDNKLNNMMPGHIYVSRNSGRTWKSLSSLRPHFWLSVASSADGLNLIAVAADGSVHTSKNSGKSWVHVALTNQPWFSTASSADGEKLVVVANGGPIYTSQDRGVNWSWATNAPNGGWARVTSSSDGQRIVAVQWRGQVFGSIDGGINWAALSVPDTFEAFGLWSVNSSADGNKLYVAGDGPNGGPIYISQPLPQLKISSTNNNAVISWPTTAVGFQLQHCSDPAYSNWIDTTLLTRSSNGWNQAIDPATTDSRFYRLRFPAGLPPTIRRFSSPNITF